MFTPRFYDYWKNDGIDPAESLRQTQIWMRDTTDREKREYFRKKLPPDVGVIYALIIPSTEDAHSFADPIHWAAFTYVGA